MSDNNTLAFNLNGQHDIPIEEIMPTRMHRLKNRVYAVQINASRFGNSKSDTSVKAEIAANKHAEYTMIGFSKQLLPKEVMAGVQQWYSRARDLMRIPKDGKYDPMRFGIAQWDGRVLISVARYHDLLAAFQNCKNGLAQEIESLRPRWDEIMRDAEEKMGDLFDADLMPSFDDFASKWTMELDIAPMPDFDPRYSLEDEMYNDVISQTFENTKNKIVGTLSKGWKESARTLLQSLEYTAAVLGNDPETVQRLNGTTGGRKSTRAVPIADTLFENLANQVRTTRSLAIAAEDEDLRKLADKVAETIGSMRADYLRANPAARKEAASVTKRLAAEAAAVNESTEKQVQDALDELSAFA